MSRNKNFHVYGVAEASPFFLNTSWSYSMYFFSSFVRFICPFGISEEFSCTDEGAVSHRSSAQMSCREEVGDSFVALGILEPQTARH
jgi:hypothetical protein